METASQPKGAGVRVLIADPNVYFAHTYQAFLRREGFEVSTARDGLDCLAQLGKFKPDVLVLEPDMPWGGGDGVLTVMHEQADVPSAAVVILTHGCSAAILYNIAPFEIADYQLKPMTPQRLAQRIRATLARQEAEKQVVAARH